MSKRTRKRIHTGLALMTLALLIFASGCALAGPASGTVSPTPEGTISAQPSKTSEAATPAPAAAETPETSETPATEQTAEPNGAGAYTITTDANESQKTYYSEQPDENALRVENGASAAIDGAQVEKRAGDAASLENALLRGLNAGVLVRAGAKLFLTGSDVSCVPSGAAGAFACGGEYAMQGGSVRTAADDSPGLAASFQGSVSAAEASVSTRGVRSPAVLAALGGSVSIEGGMAVTVGEFSPALQAAGSIEASGATLRSNNAEAAAIDGGSVTLRDCAVSGNMAFAPEQRCVLLYGSTGGSASSFSMTGGALTALSGDLFYVTNTTAQIDLNGVALSLADGRAFLRAAGNDGARGWGEAGENGASCSVTAQDQTINGDIIVDELSSVSLILKGGSVFTGTVNTANTARAASVRLENGATWNLTGNAYLTAFSGRVSGIVTNGFTVFVKGIPLAG